MLKSMNFTVLTCTLCGERIKLEPNIEFDATVHECKTAKPITDKAQPAPTKEAEKEVGFIDRVMGKKKNK